MPSGAYSLIKRLPIVMNLVQLPFIAALNGKDQLFFFRVSHATFHSSLEVLRSGTFAVESFFNRVCSNSIHRLNSIKTHRIDEWKETISKKVNLKRLNGTVASSGYPALKKHR